MRKLVIAAAIVCAAAFAQAASYTWGGSVEVYDWNNDIAGVGTLQFTIAGVAQETLTLTEGVADFEYTINSGDTVSVLATIKNFSDGTGTKTWTFDFTDAFINDKPTSDDALSAMTSDLMANLDADGVGIDFSTTASANGYAAVPEPTSGLLLLLGMAGLALKRKNA